MYLNVCMIGRPCPQKKRENFLLILMNSVLVFGCPNILKLCEMFQMFQMFAEGIAVEKRFEYI